MPDTRGATVAPIPLLNRQPSRALFFGAASDLIDGVSNSTWFTPGLPVIPQAPVEERPRRLDYPTGINISYVPRGEEQITFDQLRNLAELWDLLRLVIETRKDQIAGIPWVIRPKKEPDEKQADYKGRAKADKRSQQAIQLFLRPDGEHLWQTWIRTLLEELFVVDALSLYPFKQTDGKLYVDILDGGTIKRLLDAQGRTPAPPGMAYQQVIKGVPAFGMRSDQLFYRPRNQRSWKIYGFSPVEQIVITINLAIRRQLYKLNYYTQGNMPEAIVQMPDTWPPDRIKQFQEWWNSMLAGQLDTRRQFFFVPGFGGKDAISYPKQDVIKDEMDEWLARVVCYTFSVSPQPFIKEGMSRFGVQQQQQMAKAEGLIPTLSWIAEVLTDVMENGLGWKGLEFVFQEDTEPDLLKRAQIQEIRVRNGISAVDEVREENGDEEIGVGAGIITGSGFVPFAGQEGAPEVVGPPGFGNGDGEPGPGGGPGADVQFATSGRDNTSESGGGPSPRNGGPKNGGPKPPVTKGHGGGGRHAFGTVTQVDRHARLQQLIATFLASQARDAARNIPADYGRHRPPSERFGKQPIVVTDQPIDVIVHGDDGLRYGGNGHGLEKTATTTGVRQSTGLVHYDLEGGHVPATVPDVAAVAAAVAKEFLSRQTGLGLDQERLHLDLAAAMKDAFRDLPRAEPVTMPPINVHVDAPAPPPPPPPASITIEPTEVHVQLPEKAVHVEAGAIQVTAPPPPEVKVTVQAAKAPDVIVEAPPAPPAANITIINKQKRPKVKVKTDVRANLTPKQTRRIVKRNVLGEVESLDPAPDDEPPKPNS